jgi:hypothetical protein
MAEMRPASTRTRARLPLYIIIVSPLTPGPAPDLTRTRPRAVVKGFSRSYHSDSGACLYAQVRRAEIRNGAGKPVTEL